MRHGAAPVRAAPRRSGRRPTGSGWTLRSHLWPWGLGPHFVHHSQSGADSPIHAAPLLDGRLRPSPVDTVHWSTKCRSIFSPGARGENHGRPTPDPRHARPIVLQVIDGLARLRPEEPDEGVKYGSLALRRRPRCPCSRGIAFDQPVENARLPVRRRVVEDTAEDAIRIDTTDEAIEPGLSPEWGWIRRKDLHSPAHRGALRQLIPAHRQRRIVVDSTGDGRRDG